MPRKLLSFEKQGLSGWVCDSCRFALPKPALLQTLHPQVSPDAIEQIVIEAWEKHDCAKYPLQRERRPEDFELANTRRNRCLVTDITDHFHWYHRGLPRPSQTSPWLEACNLVVIRAGDTKPHLAEALRLPASRIVLSP